MKLLFCINFMLKKNFVKLAERNSFLKRENLDLVPLDSLRELTLNKVFIIVLSKSVCHAVLYFKEHVTSWTVSIGVLSNVWNAIRILGYRALVEIGLGLSS